MPIDVHGRSLQEFITQEGYKLEAAPKPPPAVTNAVSWRAQDGIKYRKNEVFLDVIESVSLLAGAQVQSQCQPIYSIFIFKTISAGECAEV